MQLIKVKTVRVIEQPDGETIIALLHNDLLIAEYEAEQDIEIEDLRDNSYPKEDDHGNL